MNISTKALSTWNLELPPHLAELRHAAWKFPAPHRILPANPENWLRAFELTPLEEVRCVILGQDPYHTLGKANGLAFGIHPYYCGPRNSSFKNILDEVYSSTGQRVVDFSLESWAKQGVLLINTCLTVREGEPNSHRGIGWEEFIESQLRHLLDYSIARGTPLTFLIWGAEARKFMARLRIHEEHVVLETSHPSTYSANRGFLGCSHFAHPSLVGIKWGLTDMEIEADLNKHSLKIEEE